MSDDDDFTTEVTGGYNPHTGEFFLNLRAQGSSINIKLDNVGDDDSRQRLMAMINDLPAIATEITGQMLGEISEAVAGLLGEIAGDATTQSSGVEPPRATIYTPGSLE